MEKRICKSCGQEFDPNSNRQAYCNTRCRMAAWRPTYEQRNRPRLQAKARERYLRDRENPRRVAAMNAASKAWKKRNPDKVRAATSAQNQRRVLRYKRAAMERLGGARCAWCGCDDLRLLEVNHIDGKGARDLRRDGRASRDIYRLLLKGLLRTDGLNVLCRVCNALEYAQRKAPDIAAGFTVTWRPPP